jgi:hypothetical protein
MYKTSSMHMGRACSVRSAADSLRPTRCCPQVDDATLKRLVMKVPNLLRASLARLEETVPFLCSVAGLSPAQLVQAFTAWPVLGTTRLDTLQNRWEADEGRGPVVEGTRSSSTAGARVGGWQYLVAADVSLGLAPCLQSMTACDDHCDPAHPATQVRHPAGPAGRHPGADAALVPPLAQPDGA